MYNEYLCDFKTENGFVESCESYVEICRGKLLLHFISKCRGRKFCAPYEIRNIDGIMSPLTEL